MKRLLLSTTLILGTLTGIKGAGALDQQLPAAIDGQAQVAAVTQVDPCIKTGESVVQLSAAFASLRTHAGDTSELLLTKFSALETAQGTLQRKFDKQFPAAPAAVATDINAELRLALNFPTDLAHQTAMLNKLDQALSTSGIPTSLINDRRQHIQSVVRAYLDSIIDYSPNSLTNVFTVNTLALTTMLLIVYNYLWKTEGTPKDRFAIAAPMGGGSTLATSTIAIAGVYSLLRDHALFRAYNSFNLSTQVAKLWTWLYSFFSLLFEHDNYYLYTLNLKWKGDLANPGVKAYLVKVLSAGWVLTNRPDSPKSIRTILRDGLQESKNIEEIIIRTFNLPTE